MLTTEDTDAHYNVHPGGQVVRFRDVLVTFPFSATVIGETPGGESAHVESSHQLEEIYSLSASH